MSKNRKWAVIGCCFAVAVIGVLGGYIIKEKTEACKVKQTAAYLYQKSFASLAESLDSMSTALKKSTYASTPYQQMTLAASVWKSAGEAKTSLEAIPTDALNLEKLPLFLNQSGEYVLSAAKKAMNGTELTEEETQTLQTLSEQAQTLSNQMTELVYRVNSDNLPYDKLLEFISFNDTPTEGDVAVSTGDDRKFVSENPILNMETGLNFDGLDYDGLYSGHLLSRKSVFLEDKEPITDEEARNRAAYILGCQPSDLEQSEDVTAGTVKCFSFSSKNADITVTMRQGYPFMFVKNRPIDDAQLSDEEAMEAGEKFLEKVRFSGMECASCRAEDGLLVADYVYVKDGVICYPDTVKLGIALDNGEIIGFDASGYLMNHTSERDLRPALSENEIRALFGDGIEKMNLCLIKTNGVEESEKLCYEIIRPQKDSEVRVYVNAVNGVEEEIAIIYDTEQGEIRK